MKRRTMLMAGMALFAARSVVAGSPPSTDALLFKSIDGGTLDLAQFRGGPVLVVNTASRCTFSGQYEGLQALYDKYHARGLTVVGVPSNSFRQELGSEAAVKDFCEVNFSIDFPITSLEDVTGPNAHPFYVWAREQGVEPSWNFHKILLDGNGAIAGEFGTVSGPQSKAVTAAIEALLPKS